MEAYEAAKKDSKLVGIAIHLTLIAILMAVVWSLVYLASVRLDVSLQKFFTGFIVCVIASLFIALLGGLIFSSFLFMLAKFLGGKGGFTAQTLALALIFGGSLSLAAPFLVLMQLPGMSWIFGLVAGLIFLYNVYNIYSVIKNIHQLSSLRAATVASIPVIILGALVIAVVILMEMGRAFKGPGP